MSAKVLQQIQKNAELTIKSIDAISGKIQEDNLARVLAKQSLEYSRIRNRAVERMISEHEDPYEATLVENAAHISNIHMGTLLNTSTSHIADVMIQENSKNLTSLWKAMNQNDRASNKVTEFAEEFIHFEETSIQRLKRYL